MFLEIQETRAHNEDPNKVELKHYQPGLPCISVPDADYISIEGWLFARIMVILEHTRLPEILN